MTVPVLSMTNEVIGVLQVSRKAHSPSTAGPDFASDDLRKLEAVAVAVAKLMRKDEK